MENSVAWDLAGIVFALALRYKPPVSGPGDFIKLCASRIAVMVRARKIATEVWNMLHTCLVSRVWLAVTTVALFASQGLGALTTQRLIAEWSRYHLTPESLCLAGLNSNQAGDFLTQATSIISTRVDEWNAAADIWDDRTREIGQLRIAVDAGTASHDDLLRLSQAQAEAEAAWATLESIRSSNSQAIDALLTADQRVLLGRLKSNNQRPVSPEYKALDLSVDAWSELAAALADVRSNEEPSDESLQVIQSHDSNVELQLARTRLQSQLGPINSAFSAALLSNSSD